MFMTLLKLAVGIFYIQVTFTGLIRTNARYLHTGWVEVRGDRMRIGVTGRTRVPCAISLRAFPTKSSTASTALNTTFP